MSLYLFSGVLAISIGLFFAYKRAVKGRKYRLDELRRPIVDLLDRGYESGFVVLQPVCSAGFVQFRKYVDDSGREGMELAIPIVDWSRPLVPPVRSFCERLNVSFFVEREDPKGEMEFAYADLERDSDKAYELAIEIFSLLLENPEEQRYFVMLENARSAHDISENDPG